MIIVKAPFRISFFGGSTDYKDFYEKHGSFIIGTTIDKYVYLSMRIRPSILPNESVITYSKLQLIKNWAEIQNPLIQQILKYKNINVPIEFNSFSDIPSRTGLGGSSSFCVGMLHLINKVFNEPEITNKALANEAIYVERTLLQEPGGIQDQIWPSYGGLNTINIAKNGDFFVKPLAVTTEFKEELEKSMVLIYTNDQRNQDSIAKSHENKDKLAIMDIANQAHNYFLNEDIVNIGRLMYEAWKEKSKISDLISSVKIDTMVNEVIAMGAYGVKLLGSGGCGFLLVICDPLVRNKIIERYQKNILEFKFDNNGTSIIYEGNQK